MLVGKSESGEMLSEEAVVLVLVVLVVSLPSAREVRVLACVAVSVENWARSSFRSASACSSRVSWRGLSAMSGVEVGGSGAKGSCCDRGCVGGSSVSWDELHHHPMLLIILAINCAISGVCVVVFFDG